MLTVEKWSRPDFHEDAGKSLLAAIHGGHPYGHLGISLPSRPFLFGGVGWGMSLFVSKEFWPQT